MYPRGDPRPLPSIAGPEQGRGGNLCRDYPEPEVLGNVRDDGLGSDVSDPVASPTSSNGSLSHSEWFAAEIDKKVFPFTLYELVGQSDRLGSFQRQAFVIC